MSMINSFLLNILVFLNNEFHTKNLFIIYLVIIKDSKFLIWTIP